MIDFCFGLPEPGTGTPQESGERQVFAVARVIVSRRGTEVLHELLGRLLKQVSEQPRSIEEGRR